VASAAAVSSRSRRGPPSRPSCARGSPSSSRRRAGSWAVQWGERGRGREGEGVGGCGCIVKWVEEDDKIWCDIWGWGMNWGACWYSWRGEKIEVVDDVIVDASIGVCGCGWVSERERVEAECTTHLKPPHSGSASHIASHSATVFPVPERQQRSGENAKAHRAHTYARACVSE
jgi:hypothetical protein